MAGSSARLFTIAVGERSNHALLSRLSRIGGGRSFRVDVAQQAVLLAGGGGTFVLEISRSQYRRQVERMEHIGWTVYTVTSQEELLAFAHAFSKANYERDRESRTT